MATYRADNVPNGEQITISMQDYSSMIQAMQGQQPRAPPPPSGMYFFISLFLYCSSSLSFVFYPSFSLSYFHSVSFSTMYN